MQEPLAFKKDSNIRCKFWAKTSNFFLRNCPSRNYKNQNISFFALPRKKSGYTPAQNRSRLQCVYILDIEKYSYAGYENIVLVLSKY